MTYYFQPLFDSVDATTEGGCTSSLTCGWNSECKLDQCQCLPGFSSKNGRNCLDSRCGNGQCLLCSETGRCRGCVGFIHPNSRQCLSTCSSYSFAVEGELVGRICHDVEPPARLSQVGVAVTAGICGGIALGIIIGLAIFFYLRNLKISRISAVSRDLHKHQDQRRSEYRSSFRSVVASEPGGSLDKSTSHADSYWSLGTPSTRNTELMRSRDAELNRGRADHAELGRGKDPEMGRGRDPELGRGRAPEIKDGTEQKLTFWRTISVRSLSSRGDGELKIKEKPSALRHPRDSDARAREETRSLTGSMISLGHDALSLDATTREEKLEFFRRLARLRPHAETFHDMMNMSIKRFQEVDDDREPRAETYKVVINDLSRVLLLLTKKSSIMMPADGNKLLLWAERVLQRFRQQKLDNNECNIHTMGSDQGESSDDHSDQSERGLLKGGRSRQPIKRCQSQSLQHAATRIHSKLLEKFGSTPNLKLPIGMPIAEESQSGGSSAGSSPPPPLHQSQTRRGRVVTLL